MSKYIGEVTVFDVDDKRHPALDGTVRFSTFRSGTGGQTYRVNYYPDLPQPWRIWNLVSGHGILPNGEIGRALISACEERLAKEI